MRHDDVFDRLVGDLADAANYILRHYRCGLRVDHHHAVVADDYPGVRVAFGGVGVGVLAQFVEADLFFLQVGLRGEFLLHDAHSKLSRVEDSVLLRKDVGPCIRRHLNVR